MKNFHTETDPRRGALKFQRIASFLPAATKMLCALGLEAQLERSFRAHENLPIKNALNRSVWKALQRIAFLGAVLFWLPPLHASGKPIRVVSMSPHATEILMALGAEDSLAGISDYCKTDSPRINALPRCGGPLNPNFERILALRPDLIFVLGQMDKVHRFAKGHPMRVESTFVDRFSDLTREISHLGKLLDKNDEAARLNQKLEHQLARVRRNGRSLPRYKTLILIDREPGALRRMTSVGGGSFISEMLEAAGGSNLFADQRKNYFYPSLESILALRPEVIFDIHPGMELNPRRCEGLHQDWNAKPRIPAVQRKQIVAANDEFLAIPGPRMVEIAEWFQNHLQRFAEKNRE